MHQVDFERLFQKLPSPHMVLDRALNFVAVNPAYEAVTMRRRDELIGHGLFELFPDEGEGGRRLRASIAKAFETGESDTLAYIRYDIPNPDAPGGFEERYWTAIHTPLPDGDGGVRLLMQNTVDVTDIVRMREAMALPFRVQPGETQLIERAREAENANRALMAESADFRRLFQQAPQMIAVLSGPGHILSFVNDACRQFLGGRDVAGLPVREAVPEVEGQGFFEILDDVFCNGTEHSGEGAPVTLRREPGGESHQAFMDFSYRPVRDAAGRITGVFFQGVDRTEAARNAGQQRRLLDELNHRVKNTLASVQSIASQTLRSARDLPSARRDFEARIVALSKAHNLLSVRSWSSLQLEALIRQELSAFGSDRVTIGGPPVSLDPKTAIAVAMMVHELGSNARRYGSLSVPSGKLAVEWEWSGEGADRDLLISWRESEGPVVQAPQREGFGSRVLHRVATGELGARLVADYAPEGFFCQIDVPADNIDRARNDAA